MAIGTVPVRSDALELRGEPAGCCAPRLAGEEAARAGREAAVFAALGDGVRLGILQLLSRHDALCVCEIQSAFDLGQPTISHHLRVLRDAGLVTSVRRGVWAYYRIRRDAVKATAQTLLGWL
jgi:ArsR family transcriptional regulator